MNQLAWQRAPRAQGAKVDVDAAAPRAFAIAEELEPFVSEWHRHDRHQLLYSARGTMRLQFAGKQWLLPPQRAAWLPRGAMHQVSASGPVLLRTVYLGQEIVEGIPELCRRDCLVFPVSPLVREMILHGMRWPHDHDPADPLPPRFFALCAELCAELSRGTLPLWLPTGQTDEVRRAVDFTRQHLAEKLRQADVARACGLSERSLSRRFPEETDMTWQRFLQQARLLRAAELLSVPGARVTDAAFEVGFESLPAFTRAFERLMGETPKVYRSRMLAAPVAASA